MEKSPKKFLKNPLPWVILLVTALLFVPGCGKREMEELIFVMGIGVDLGKEEGTYLVTLQMALPKMGGGSAAELDNLTMSIETSSLSLVTEQINEALDKQPFTGTTRVIILGEELARSGIDEALDFFQRYYQYRRTAYLLIAKGQAKDILETELRNEEMPSLSVLATIEGQKELTVSPVTRLGHYLTILGREGQAPLIPTVEVVEPGQHGFQYKDEKGKELLVHEAGVFKEGKMIDILTDQECRGYLWLDNEVDSRFIHSQEQNGLKLSGWIVDSKTKYKVADIDGKLGMKFIIDARLSIREIMGQYKVMEDEEWQKFLKDSAPYFAREIQEECEAALAKSKEIQLDFAGIGRKIEIKNPKYWRQIKSNWEEELVNFPVAIEVEVDVEHSGLVRNSPSSINDN